CARAAPQQLCRCAAVRHPVRYLRQPARLRPGDGVLRWCFVAHRRHAAVPRGLGESAHARESAGRSSAVADAAKKVSGTNGTYSALKLSPTPSSSVRGDVAGGFRQGPRVTDEGLSEFARFLGHGLVSGVLEPDEAFLRRANFLEPFMGDVRV